MDYFDFQKIVINLKKEQIANSIGASQTFFMMQDWFIVPFHIVGSSNILYYFLIFNQDHTRIWHMHTMYSMPKQMRMAAGQIDDDKLGFKIDVFSNKECENKQYTQNTKVGAYWWWLPCIDS